MMYMTRRCFRTKRHTWQPQTTPKYPKPLNLFTVSHQIAAFIFHSKLLHLFIISSGMGYQRCLLAQYNEHPYSLIWVFAADKRQWNMSRSGLLQKQKKKKNLNEIESDAQETPDQQKARLAYACMCICVVWSRSLGLYSKKDLHEIWDGIQEYIWSTKFQIGICMYIRSLSSIFAIENKNVRPFCLAPAHSPTEPACDVCFYARTIAWADKEIN